MFPGDEWTRMMERVTRDQRRLEELTRGALGHTSALDYIQEQQRRSEELTTRSTSALDYIQEQQRRYEELTAQSPMATVDPLTLTTQRLAAEEALRGTNFETLRLSLPEILGARSFDAAQLEPVMAGHVAGVSDLERALGPIMPAPAYLAWSEHFRTAALPTLSFLAQDWTMPLGLMLEGPSALQASVAWKVHQPESSVHVVAITPQAEIGHSPRLSLETEVVCALCGGRMLPIGNARLTLIGPRRGVLKRPIFPACATCSQNIPALLAALHELTDAAAPRLEIIRGGGQGDGVRKGDLRLVRSEPAKQDPNTP
jgi:hypothetical protein